MEWEWWSWVAQVLETVVVMLLAPVALWQLWLQRKATLDQATATLHQTIAIIISWVQAEEIREGRRLLFDLEDKQAISKLPVDQWKEEWKQAADRVSQSFNSAAIVAQQDPRLQEIWIRPTRRAILKSWEIAQPRIRERRSDLADLWREFEWLAKKAKEYSSVEGNAMTNQVRYQSWKDIWSGHGLFALVGYFVRDVHRRTTPTKVLFRLGRSRWLERWAYDEESKKVVPWWQDVVVFAHAAATALIVYLGVSASGWVYTVVTFVVWYFFIDMIGYHASVLWFDDLAIGETAEQRMVWSHRRILFQALVNFAESISLFPVLYIEHQPTLTYYELLNYSFSTAFALARPESLASPNWLVNAQIVVSAFFLVVVISVVASIAYKRPDLTHTFDD